MIEIGRKSEKHFKAARVSLEQLIISGPENQSTERHHLFRPVTTEKMPWNQHVCAPLFLSPVCEEVDSLCL